jgi:hypothetical protein
MSVDSKLFVVVEKDKVLDVIDEVILGLNKWIKSEAESYYKAHTEAKSLHEFYWNKEYESHRKLFSVMGVAISAYKMDMILINFGCGDSNRRNLSVFPKDFHDYNHIATDNKLVFSIGDFGKNNQIMMVVAEACKPFGKVYYDRNDCDDEDFVELN